MGDPGSKIGGPAAAEDGRDQGMPVEALAVMVTGVGDAKPRGAKNTVVAAADMPKVVEVTGVGLGGGTGASRAAASNAHRGGDGADDDSVDVGVDVIGGSGHNGGEVETVERRAIVKLFRAVDVDASGHVSQEELLKAVR